MHQRYFLALLILLALKATILVYVILHAGIGLGPDEAQYWTWSQALDWGYYSKPPGIAWEIWLGTQLFGSTELGVRSIPLMIGFIIPLLVYYMARRCSLSPSGCFWAAICFALSPLGILASFLAITDGGMVLFWTLSCAYLAGKIECQEKPNYLLLGSLIFLGALFKWTMYFFWGITLIAWLRYSWLASWKAGKRLLLGVLVSLFALIPSVYWNARHEWATFRHVGATLLGGHAPKEGRVFSGNLLEFLGAQMALVSPILFVLGLLAIWHCWRNRRQVSQGVEFCGIVTTIVLGAGMIASLFMKIQGNWAIFAYPTAFICLAWYAIDEKNLKKWIMAGVLLSFVLSAAVFSIPSVQFHRLFSAAPIPYKISPFRHNVGWNELAPILQEIGYHPQTDFLFSDKYQTTSILSFYGPQQKRAYFFNLGGARKNQFSYWPGTKEEQIGKRGFFFVIENRPQLDDLSLIEKYEKALAPYCQKVRFLGVKPLFWAYGQPVKGALIFECQGYNGLVPIESNLY